MTRAAIFTLDATTGGVPALAHAVYDVLARAGHAPSLVYRSTEATAGLGRAALLRHLATTPVVRAATLNGLPSRAVAAYPLPPRWQYGTLGLARADVRAPIAAVVSGSSHVGLARARSGRPYVLWTATKYGDEIAARADGGDAWAARLLRDPDWPHLEAQERLVYERATVALVTSPHTRARLVAAWPHLAGRIRHVFHPVDTTRFAPASDAADPPYVLMAARLRDPRKNAGLLVRAFARIHATVPSLRLVMAGDDPPADLVALADTLGVKDRVMFAGHVDRDALVALHQRAMLFVLPSRQEGLGIAVEEAMSCGVPVISTRCGGPEDLVDDGRTGLLVPNDDERALAGALAALTGDPARCRAMGQAARERATAWFSHARVAGELHAAFAEAFGDVFTATSAHATAE